MDDKIIGYTNRKYPLSKKYYLTLCRGLFKFLTPNNVLTIFEYLLLENNIKYDEIPLDSIIKIHYQRISMIYKLNEKKIEEYYILRFLNKISYSLYRPIHKLYSIEILDKSFKVIGKGSIKIGKQIVQGKIITSGVIFFNDNKKPKTFELSNIQILKINLLTPIF